MINRITTYWNSRSTSWRKERDEAWSRPETERWLEFFKTVRSQVAGNKVLEVGTATGYFANIMTLAGFEVTAVDLSPQMIEYAKLVSQDLELKVDYQVMDAQALQLEDNSFDLVFTRLMTWTIPDLEKCYQEMKRVLKAGGKLINLDADFGKTVFSTDRHDECPSGAIAEVNAIKAALEISNHERPAKDLELLQAVGFDSVQVDQNAQNRILGLPPETAGLFMLEGTKTR
ncbi:class I SAM-dependent methyltransferase [Sphingobacterium sp. N143]|uniref:class I SAM-dependent methyltransferase n=1 Tax=Sphingobacterium sp. N143 TaxID=2746727 RepID=UPI002578D39E|nr:class I SAM-dependent methyltransferase [Sphingobacterium sp. N143]MDM1292689.1 class I SAM-dependent methyltransferase [Sphingobacterium sp. N143]